MDDVRDFARSYTEAWSSGDPARVAEHYASDGSLTINAGSPSAGRDAITEAAQAFMTAFPDMQVLMDGLRDGERGLEYHWTLVGTNAETGKRVRISGFEEWTLEDGLIRESLGHFDEAEYDRQLRHGA